jgi:hypothetical protein
VHATNAIGDDMMALLATAQLGAAGMSSAAGSAQVFHSAIHVLIVDTGGDLQCCCRF